MRPRSTPAPHRSRSARCPPATLRSSTLRARSPSCGPTRLLAARLRDSPLENLLRGARRGARVDESPIGTLATAASATAAGFTSPTTPMRRAGRRTSSSRQPDLSTRSGADRRHRSELPERRVPARGGVPRPRQNHSKPVSRGCTWRRDSRDRCRPGAAASAPTSATSDSAADHRRSGWQADWHDALRRGQRADTE